MLGKAEPDDSFDEDQGVCCPPWFHAPILNVAATCVPEDASKSGAFLSFSGDGDDEAVDLFADAQKAVEEAEAAEDQEEVDEGDVEDDFNAAWEVLEVARAIYEKQQDESDEIKLKLADVFITLGDVSLETGTNTIPCNPCYTHPDRVSQRNSIKPSRTTLPVLL